MADNGTRGSFEESFYSIPTITRSYLVIAFMTTACCSLGLLSPVQLYLEFGLVWSKFQVWRLFTCFIFFGKFSFPFAFQLYLLYSYSRKYEEAPFPSSRVESPTADYMYMLMFGMFLLVIVSWFTAIPFMGSAMVFMILYVWSRKNPESPCGLFSFRFKGLYLPWVYCAFSIVIGNSPVMNLLGIACGHVYYFLLQILPVSHGYEVIKTPQFLINLFESAQYTHSFTAAGNEVRGARPQGVHRWGGGTALGGDQ